MADSPRLNNDEALVHRDIEFALEATEAAANIFSAPLLPSDIISPSTTSRRLVSAMTRHTDNQDPRNSQFTREFAYKVQRDWVRVKNPCTVITEDLPTYVRSLTVRPNTLSRRVANSVPQYAGVWVFEVRSDGMPLRNIALVLNEHRENFYIASVKNERGQSLGMCDGQEWFDNSSAAVSATSHWEQRATNSHNTETQLPMPSFCYNIEIAFASTAYGTYRQNVLFGFGGYPVIRRRICIDCVHVDDMNRLTEATKYILQQTANSWTSTEAGGVHQFESPFVLGKDPRETYLEKAYPYPMENDFMLSNATLSEDSITPTNYRGRMHELISVEELARHEQIARYNRVTTIKLSMSYILASDTDGSTTAKYAPPGELFAELPLGRSVSEDMKSGRLLLRGCTSILIKAFNPTGSAANKNEVFQAHVEDKCSNSIHARLSKSCVERLDLKPDTQATMDVQFVLSRAPFCEWHRAVDCLPDTRLVFPPPHFTLPGRLPSLLHPDKDWHRLLDKRLNPKQVEAVTTMVAPSDICLPPILLLGPYGTGKTFTIAQALLIMLLDNPRNKVLLCTQSNSASDLYVKEFFDEWYTSTNNERLKPMRIYYSRRLRNTVHPLVRKYCLIDANGYFREPTKEDVDNSGLIVTTLATSSCLTALDFEPTHIVIDEAAQALEAEAITTLGLANRRTRVILAGDQMQLAPEVYSDLAAERGLGVSLLERLHNTYDADHPCRIRLCQNYRSHAEIVKLTSNLFYGNEIEPGCPSLPRTSNPLMFYAVHGNECQGDNSTGFYNDREAVEIAERVQALKRAWPIEQWGAFDEDSIGVLSHYSEQVVRIRNELRKRKLFKVSVERVLNVQGKQFTAVFISTVRTTKCMHSAAESNVSDYGFLTNPRLLNTAITRAKSLVAVVGDPVALLTIGPCRTLWAKYFQTASIRGIALQKLQRYMVMCFAPQLPAGVPLNPLAREFVPRENGPPAFNDWIGMEPNTDADWLICPNPWAPQAEPHRRV